MLDHATRVPRDEFRCWTENYVDNMQAARKRTKTTTQAQAKRHALGFLFGNGLSGVGSFERIYSIDHPLALAFAGTALRARLMGLEVADVEEISTPRRARRRKFPEAFGEEDNNERSVKQSRVEVEIARAEEQYPEFGDGLDLGNDTAPEVGLEAAAALEDKHSSSFMPWSRQGSVAPGSATRAPGSAQKSIMAPSPLHGRGSVIGSIEMHSDPPEDALGAIGFDCQPSSLDLGQDQMASEFHIGNNLASTQELDASSQQFLGYVAAQAAQHGTSQTQGSTTRHWLSFEDLADPEVHSKAIAAQAFLHILSLATKSVISVKQAGIDDKEPFGELRIGVNSSFMRITAEIHD
jgi:hypothetical protein